MNAATLFVVGLAGGAGALLRFAIDGAVLRRLGRPLPLGTFVVNISGALLLGLLTGIADTGTTTQVLGMGLLGGYTTFSTWMFESQRLAEDGQLAWAAVNLSASAVFGLLAAILGRALTGG